MSGNSIGFGEEIKKLCRKMCSVRILIWSPEMGNPTFAILYTRQLNLTLQKSRIPLSQIRQDLEGSHSGTSLFAAKCISKYLGFPKK